MLFPPGSTYQRGCHTGGTKCSDSYSCMREFSSLLARILVPGYYYLLMHGFTSPFLPLGFCFLFPSHFLFFFGFVFYSPHPLHLRVKNVIPDTVYQNWHIPLRTKWGLIGQCLLKESCLIINQVYSSSYV